MRRLLYFVVGIVTGSAAGAGVSLLFSPASGKEMRTETRQRFEEMLQESAQIAAQRRAELEDELHHLTTPSASDEA